MYSKLYHVMDEYPSFKYQKKLRKLLSTRKHLYYQHNVTKLHYVNMTRHEYNIQEISLLLSLKRSGMNNSEISRQEGVPLTTVRRLINKHLKDNGASFGAPTRRGLSSGLTRREKSAVIRNVRKNPKQTLAELCKYGTGVRSLNPRTVHHVLDEVKISLHSSVGAPLLTLKQRRARLAWARDHASWSVQNWRHVLWSDESGRHLGVLSKKPRVWRRPDERLAYNMIHPTHTANCSYVGYWGAISGQGVGPLFIIPHTTHMNTASFKSVMEEVMIPYYNSLSGHYIFQQDGATYHTARSVLSFLEDQGVEVMKWPSQSPDLNPIEHIWKMLNEMIDKRMKDTHSYQELERVVQEEWRKLDVKKILNCIDSMPSRCKSVIKNKGQYSGY